MFGGPSRVVVTNGRFGTPSPPQIVPEAVGWHKRSGAEPDCSQRDYNDKLARMSTVPRAAAALTP